MERTFRLKNAIELAKIVIAPGGRVEVISLPQDDRFTGVASPAPLC